MSYSPHTLTALFLASATPALAEVPVVVTDFGPTNAIVTSVMQGVGTPIALLLPNDDPHSFAMRPSHALLLEDADVVVWVGADLTPWLEEPVATLARDAASVELLETDGWTPLEMREGHDHDHGHDDHDGEAHDPHAWLDPDIAANWAMTIAELLSTADPANATIYQTNANQFWADTALLDQELTAAMTKIDSTRILLPHDSMQYFETRFALATAGFIANGDAADPGPAHLRDLRAKVTAGEVTCVMSDVETNPGTLTILTEGTEAKIGTLDVTDRANVGYIEMMRSIATSLAECAS